MTKQTQNNKKNKKFRVGSTEIEIIVENHMAAIYKTNYPLAGAGNNYGKYIRVDIDKGIVKLVAFCDTWAVPPCRGTDVVKELEIEDKVLAEEIYNKIATFESDNDESAAKLFKQLAELIDKHYEKRIYEIEESYEKFVLKMRELRKAIEEKLEHVEKTETAERLLEIIRSLSPEELLEALDNCL